MLTRVQGPPPPLRDYTKPMPNQLSGVLSQHATHRIRQHADTILTRHTQTNKTTHLQASECSNHDDAQAQAAREEVVQAHLLDDVTSSGALLGVQLGHQVVCCSVVGWLVVGKVDRLCWRGSVRVHVC